MAVIAEVSVQPWVATRPSRASRATITRSLPKRRHSSSTSAGLETAAVPTTTRAAPAPNRPAAVSALRMPPPTCTGMVRALRD